jgi:hypothetical protein
MAVKLVLVPSGVALFCKFDHTAHVNAYYHAETETQKFNRLLRERREARETQRHDHFRALLLDNDIPESDIERLAIQNGWSMQQIAEWYADQGLLDIPEPGGD